MKVCVVGLGLIGGSICKALKKYTNHTVLVLNRSENKVTLAIEDKSADAKADLENDDIDVIWLCTYKSAIEKFIKDNAEKLKKGTIIADVCGLKGNMTKELTEIANSYGLRYVGTHPMAGKEVNGYAYSEADLFKGCNFILTPTDSTDKEALEIIEKMAIDIGCRNVVYCDPEKHDEMIAFTSHMPHIAANSLVNNELTEFAGNFAGGAFRDVTRVSRMDREMWSELFLENREFLLKQLYIYRDNINRYIKTIEDDDYDTLSNLIQEGTCKKEKQLGKQ